MKGILCTVLGFIAKNNPNTIRSLLNNKEEPSESDLSRTSTCAVVILICGIILIVLGIISLIVGR